MHHYQVITMQGVKLDLVTLHLKMTRKETFCIAKRMNLNHNRDLASTKIAATTPVCKKLGSACLQA